MMAYSDERGRLIKVEGDPKHEFTSGRLCSKGYLYTQYVYHPQRIIYPMLQRPRFSGNWRRVSWQDAINIISNKIIAIKDNYNSYLPIALLKGPGNYGVFAEATEGFFSSLGPITQISGSPCLAAGWDAQFIDFGGTRYRDPKEMKNAKMLILWGVNPAATAIHQVPMIQEMRKNGTKVILIDVIPTATLKHVDEFYQVRPGGDGALALAVIQKMLINQLIDQSFIREKSIGWEDFEQWLLRANPLFLVSICGISDDAINRLAQIIASAKPVAFWPGPGMQRYTNGGQNMRAIDALAAVSGSFDLLGGGIFFPNIDFWRLNHRIFSSATNLDLSHENRLIGVQALAQNLADCQDPPVRMFWITCSNPLARATDLKNLRNVMSSLEFTVTVDHFLTATAQASDLVLPATTCFESPDIVIGYWHNFIGLNQQAIKPVGETRSELAIATSLAQSLNQIEPGISSFPENGDEERWLKDRILPCLERKFNIKDPQNLVEPFQLRQSYVKEGNSLINTPSGKYQFKGLEAVFQGNPELPILLLPQSPSASYPYRFLVLHKAENLNTQFSSLEIPGDTENEEVFLSKETAKRKGISTGDKVIIYNNFGEIQLFARIKARIPDDLLICYSWRDLNGAAVNILTSRQDTDLGRSLTGFSGVAYHDTFVNISRGIGRKMGDGNAVSIFG
jgi:Anaerobic dehydrogenases, typically selenocysteine-containing